MKAEELYGEGQYTYLGNGEFQSHGGHMPSKLKVTLYSSRRPSELTAGSCPPAPAGSATVLRIHAGLDHKGEERSAPERPESSRCRDVFPVYTVDLDDLGSKQYPTLGAPNHRSDHSRYAVSTILDMAARQKE